MKNAIDDTVTIINGIHLAQQNQRVRKPIHSHSIVAGGLPEMS